MSKATGSATKPHGLKEVLAELKKNGSAQTRKTYRNAGIGGEMFGVSYAFMKKLHKRLGTDHDLALALWESGILDARIVGCWVADADKTTVKLLETWARDESEPMIAGELAAFAQDTDLAAGRMRKWIGMKSTYRTTLGWSIAGRLVMQPGRGPDEGGVTEDDVADLLKRIENGLQAAPDKTRHVMNSTLIAIGCRPG
ncbi:MAG: DNA alkylation repair protein [Planctomycetota bacterium]